MAACGDSAPNASPVLALVGFDVAQVITFSAIGGFSYTGGTPAGGGREWRRGP